MQRQLYVYEQSPQNIPEYNVKKINEQLGLELRSAKNSMHGNYQKQQNDQIKQIRVDTAVNESKIYDLNNNLQVPYQENQILDKQEIESELRKSDMTQKNIESKNHSSRQNVQSAIDIGERKSINTKKILPGINFKQKQKNDIRSNDQSNGHYIGLRKANKNFRISQAKDKSNIELSRSNITNQNKSAFISNSSQLSLLGKSRQLQGHLVNINKNRVKKQHENQTISQEKLLGNSRSVGVGNHKITKQDLQVITHSRQQIDENNQYEKKVQQIIHNKVQLYDGKNKESTNKQYHNPQMQQERSQQNQKHTFVYEDDEKTKQYFYRKQGQQSPKQDVIVHYENQNQRVENKLIINSSKSPLKNKTNGNANEYKVLEQIKERMAQVQLQRNHTKQQEEPQTPIQQINTEETFNIKEYARVHDILKSIHDILKFPVINVKQLLLSIKKYLGLIAAGNIDNIDEFDIILHKKKIIKSSLFLQRVSIVMLACAYATHNLKQSLKYLINIIGYSITNCLILIKIMEETQIINNQRKSKTSSRSVNAILQKSDRLAMNRNLDTLKNNNNVINDTIHKVAKNNETFYENINEIMKEIGKTSIQQAFYNLLQYFAYFLCLIERDNMIPFLAIAPNPYLSPTFSTGRYTLVIDCIQVFCQHHKKTRHNTFRPYAQHFLSQMSKYFEIVSYCAALPNQVDRIIDMIDQRKNIQHRLYKHHTINSNKHYLKCLDRLGRNEDEIILLDNENQGGAGSIQNCINIPEWRGRMGDTVLAELCPLLAMIALKKLPTREAVRKVRQQVTKNKKQGVNYINFGVFLQ